MKTCLFAVLTAVVLCGCTSFEVSLKLPGVESADVAFSANAVASMGRMESGEVVKLASGVWRVRLKESQSNFTLPFVPAEMLVSVKLNGDSGVFYIECTESATGEALYKIKPLAGSAKNWQVEVVSKDSAGLVITVTTGK